MSSVDHPFPDVFGTALRSSLTPSVKPMPGPRPEARLAALRIPGLCHFVKTAAPLAVVTLSLEILHFFGISVAVPGLPLLAAIVCTGFWAGMRAGLIATAVSSLYELLWFGYASEDGIVRVGVFSISAVITAVLVGMLRNRVEATTYAQAHHRAVEMWKTNRRVCKAFSIKYRWACCWQMPRPVTSRLRTKKHARSWETIYGGSIPSAFPA